MSGLASALILSSTVPQFFQTMKTRLTRDISMKFLAACVAGQMVWILYGTYTNQPVLVLGEGFDSALWVVVLIIKVVNVMGRKETKEIEEVKQIV